MRLSVGDREEGDDMGFETRGVPSFGPLMHGNQWLQKWVAAAASLFPACCLQGTVQLCRAPWIECASGGAIAAHGADSYGARSTWRQAAGRSAIFGPGLGFAGGPGLGCSTASVNQYASSWSQPSSAGRGGWGVHSLLSDGQTSRTWK